MTTTTQNASSSSMVARDLANMSDLLTTESLTYLKAKTYSEQVSDQKAQQVLKDVMKNRKKGFS